VFSSDKVRSKEKGVQLGLSAERSYGDVDDMCATERTLAHPIDAVAIMTPNDKHYSQTVAALDAGFDVICDKPITITAAEARDVAARVEQNDRVYGIAHAYSAYAMTRYARRLATDGTLGRIRLVQVEYIQSGLATKLEDAPRTNRLNWILDANRSGLALVMSAIGCHVHHLACFSVASNVAEVSADMAGLVEGRTLIDYTSAHLKFENGARGTFTVTQAAAGGENDIRLRIYGDNGMIDWNHQNTNYLRVQMQGEPVKIVTRGDPFLPPEIARLSRTPRGHPEGLREAFANVYREFAEDIIARNLGAPRSTAPYPRIADGVHTMAFIEACVESTRNEARWTKVPRS